LKEELKSLYRIRGHNRHSEPLRRVLEDVKRVAGTEATVLILGEMGTGRSS
jgi:transcriptional regulator with PAS, ATPase and Fis domain